MPELDINLIKQYVADNIGVFHGKRLQSLSLLKLDKVIQKKNPYLFKAKNMQTASDIVKAITDAYISSSEEGIFGDWLEGLAIYINGVVFNGRKSVANGIDLEFDFENIRYIVSIKSGPNWGNSSQVNKMKLDFKNAKIVARTSNSSLQVVAVNGCCYGRDNNPDKGDYFKYCGQRFWSFISGDENLYTDIIEPLGFEARKKNDEFYESYSRLLNQFTREFLEKYCNSDDSINWQRIVEFNSSVKKPHNPKQLRISVDKSADPSTNE